ncbi:hypothetical protein P5V15_011986 [Pogonomyrmex californicus]
MLPSVLILFGVTSICQSAVLQKLDPRIINGEDVNPGEIPYQISLQSRNNVHFCGGSILNENFAITAAHCVEGKTPADMKIIAGTINLNRPYLTQAIKKIIRHKEYDPGNSYVNDIALLNVFVPFKPSNLIGFVTLPEQDEVVQEEVVARVSGFGRLSVEGPASKILQKATIYTAKQDYCRYKYREIIYNIYNTHICAFDPAVHRGSCNGDSGGPLIVNGKLVGLVSWAKSCADTDYPTVFTRVPSYVNWIKENAVV